jgi:hypothetical protein
VARVVAGRDLVADEAIEPAASAAPVEGLGRIRDLALGVREVVLGPRDGGRCLGELVLGGGQMVAQALALGLDLLFEARACSLDSLDRRVGCAQAFADHRRERCDHGARRDGSRLDRVPPGEPTGREEGHERSDQHDEHEQRPGPAKPGCERADHQARASTRIDALLQHGRELAARLVHVVDAERVAGVGERGLGPLRIVVERLDDRGPRKLALVLLLLLAHRLAKAHALVEHHQRRLGLASAPSDELVDGLELEQPRGAQALEQAIDVARLDAVVFLAQPVVELGEDVLDQARPQVGLDVVPGVEADLDDVPVKQRVALAVAVADLLDRGVDLLHEVGLARAPLPEHADRQRRMDLFGQTHPRERGRLALDPADQIRRMTGDRVGGVVGHHHAARHRDAQGPQTLAQVRGPDRVQRVQQVLEQQAGGEATDEDLRGDQIAGFESITTACFDASPRVAAQVCVGDIGR